MPTKNKRISLGKAFSELKKDEPRIVAKTRRKKGKSAARKQIIAIAMSKAKKSKY